mmetsp:Transcript_3702/g.10012  ORF Transcript_3702/g.10012 Transcript_3702/m.10012 type:complete len:205 (-) Transcript_3702:116-730(-)
MSPSWRSSSHWCFIASLRVSRSCPRVATSGWWTCSRLSVLASRSGLTAVPIGSRPPATRAAWWSASALSRMFSIGHSRGCDMWVGGWRSSTGACSRASLSPTFAPPAFASDRRACCRCVLVGLDGTLSAFQWLGELFLLQSPPTMMAPRTCFMLGRSLGCCWSMPRMYLSRKPFWSAVSACRRSPVVRRPSLSPSKHRPMKWSS